MTKLIRILVSGGCDRHGEAKSQLDFFLLDMKNISFEIVTKRVRHKGEWVSQFTIYDIQRHTKTNKKMIFDKVEKLVNEYKCTISIQEMNCLN